MDATRLQVHLLAYHKVNTLLAMLGCSWEQQLALLTPS